MMDHEFINEFSEIDEQAFNNLKRKVGNYGNYKPKKNRVKQILYLLLFLIVINAAVTSFIYGIKHPKKTETERFLHIPKSFIWNFK